MQEIRERFSCYIAWAPLHVSRIQGFLRTVFRRYSESVRAFALYQHGLRWTEEDYDISTLREKISGFSSRFFNHYPVILSMCSKLFNALSHKLCGELPYSFSAKLRKRRAITASVAMEPHNALCRMQNFIHILHNPIQ